MTENVSTETLMCDDGYRWNDNLTEAMGGTELRDYLISEAFKYEAIEWEVAYGIYRELVWRFPDDSNAWLGLSRSAQQMQRQSEAIVADKRARELAQEV